MTKSLSRQPRHVPDSLVFDFDMFNDPEYNQDPYKRVVELGKEAPPVFWTRCNGGHWIVQGFQAAFETGTKPDLFSSEIVSHSLLHSITSLQKGLSYIGIKTPRIPLPYPILVDPPLHARYRQPLQTVFSPKNIKTMEARLRKSAIELIEEFSDNGQCEFMSAVAEPLPVRLFLQLFGLPVEKLPEYRTLLKLHMKQITQASSNLEKLAHLQGIADGIRSTLLERRDDPKDDLISLLWQTKLNDKPVTLEDMENYGVLLFLGGLDTVVHSMGLHMRHLALNPNLQSRLRNEPERINDAVEEITRRYAIAVPLRKAKKSIEFHGAHLKKNDVMYLFLHSANLDPEQFENPEIVDLDRPNKRKHVTFNSGPHHCLGANLARLELRILYEEMLSRLPTFRLDPNNPPKFECGYTVGLESLNLVWDV